MALLTAAMGGLVLASTASASLYGNSNLNHSCVLQQPLLSCSTAANYTLNRALDTCCVETFGGLVLNTQFWSTYTGYESAGQKLPADSWTLHGLWPDFCNGSYTQYCDLSRQYDPVPSPNTTTGTPSGTPVPAWKGATVDTFLRALGKLDLLAFMQRFWVNRDAPNTEIWAHEFSKHATCFSTFDVPCYGPQYRQGQDVVDYFETSVLYFNRLPTWGWLATANIRPSNATNGGYNLTAIRTALTRGYGALPYVGCSGPRWNATEAGRNSTDNGFTVLSEVWYYSYVYGRPQLGQWVPINATGSTSNCAQAAGAVRYPTRSTGSLF